MPASSAPTGRSDIGQTVRLPGIARTLRAIARHGRDGFYEGEFGRGLLELGARPLRAGRLRHQRSRVVHARCTLAAWGHELWTVPPPSQGYLTLAGAAVAEAAGLGTDPDDPQWAHLLVETWRAVGHDRPACSSTAPTATRSSTPSAWPPRRPGSTRSRVAPPDVAARATGPRTRPWPASATGTPHTCARMDADGLGVSLTQSNALDFGSHLVEPSTGVFLHNRGVGFSLVPGHPAEVAPGGGRRTPSPPCW